MLASSRSRIPIFFILWQGRTKVFRQKFGSGLKILYLCTAEVFSSIIKPLSYGVMVAQQVLVLFVVVRIRLGQLNIAAASMTTACCGFILCSLSQHLFIISVAK
jgi:hypothetical protein